MNVYCLWASKVCKKETRTEHDCDKSNTTVHTLTASWNNHDEDDDEDDDEREKLFIVC